MRVEIAAAIGDLFFHSFLFCVYVCFKKLSLLCELSAMAMMMVTAMVVTFYAWIGAYLM